MSEAVVSSLLPTVLELLLSPVSESQLQAETGALVAPRLTNFHLLLLFLNTTMTSDNQAENDLLCQVFAILL